MVTYRIRDWDKHFEVAQTRKLRHSLNWVAISTKHDGKGFRRIMRSKSGPSIYGAWILLITVAAKCKVRGVLADEDGPLSEEDLELKTGCPAKVFAEAIELLSSKEVGWLEPVPSATTVDDSGRAVDDSGSTVDGSGRAVDDFGPTRQDKTEQNRTVQDSTGGGGGTPDGEPPPLTPEDVLEAWNSTPGLIAARTLSDDRKKTLRVRIRDPDFVENWRTALRKVAASDFCRGINDRGWAASIDWFIAKSTLNKILEGKYDNRKPASRSTARLGPGVKFDPNAPNIDPTGGF